MLRYLIRREDRRDWDDIVLGREVCRPRSVEVAPWDGGDIGFEVGGSTFAFIYEMFGIDVEVDAGGLDRAGVERILIEVIDSMAAATGTPGFLVDLDAAEGQPIVFD